MMDARLKQYLHTHGKEMPCEAIAQMLSTTLYYRRFFPYYTYNMVAGLDKQGKGNVRHFVWDSGHPVQIQWGILYKYSGAPCTNTVGHPVQIIGRWRWKFKSISPHLQASIDVV